MKCRDAPSRILVADDDRGIRRFLGDLLESQGFTVVLAENGEQVATLFAEQLFDLVLLDLRMGISDGLEVARVLRAQEAPSGRKVPILAMSADADAATVQRCLESGMDGYIAKPFDYRQLIARIETLIGLSTLEEKPQDDRKPREEKGRSLSPLLTNLAGRFLEDAVRLSDEIRSALIQRDAERLQTAAHQLYGSAGLFQAERARLLAHRLEESAKAGDFSERSHALERDLAAELSELRLKLLDTSAPS